MSDYRDDFDTSPRYRSGYDDERAGFVGPFVILGILLVMIVGVFFFSSGTSDLHDINAGRISAVQTPESAPAAQ